VDSRRRDQLHDEDGQDSGGDERRRPVQESRGREVGGRHGGTHPGQADQGSQGFLGGDAQKMRPSDADADGRERHNAQQDLGRGVAAGDDGG
jgi:hypothetical protein